jgi:phage terminase large subunit-like protein
LKAIILTEGQGISRNQSFEALLKNPDQIRKLTPKQKELFLKKLDEYEADLLKKQAELEALDPFWFYEPSEGIVTDEGMSLLTHFLKPDDIPQGRLDGQMDFHCSHASIRGESGGNQSGKTTSEVIDDFIEGLKVLPHSMKGKYPEDKWSDKKPYKIRTVSVDYTTLLNTILPTYKHWVPRDYLIGGSWDKSYREEGKDGQRVLKLGNWKKDELLCTIEFMTNEMKVTKFQGPPLDKVNYDEEPRQDIYKENLLRFTTAKKMNIVFAFTPTNGLSWATDLFDRGQTDSGASVELYKLCSVTNKKANMDVLKEILGKLDNYEEVKMRLLGEFISLSGLVYGRLFSPRVHVIPPFHINRDYLVVLGLDPHLVTPTAGVFVAVDREQNYYVIHSIFKQGDTEEIKAEVAKAFSDNAWRWGWSVADKSSDTSIMAFGGRNIFKELTKSPNAIKALRTSEKFEGSIKAGVDEIKRLLRVNPDSGKPRLYIFDTYENRELIQSFRTLERDTFANEDKQGMKDKIREGKHHLHAALRYVFQHNVLWVPEIIDVPEPRFNDAGALW